MYPGNDLYKCWFPFLLYELSKYRYFFDFGIWYQYILIVMEPEKALVRGPNLWQ